ncbi:hypothetical protein C814_00625 [Anaerotruncus sp. G3(2012)]|uniref:metal ABC transporter ATP-binding protein n=1 Tax=Anaerotruncus sp. G3(2012) TaxID=1235835 RepID=UPI0003383B40|nr:metal ABC transporter ATP-binding protein [Anaerotruncus sp. G3(2012)]EOS63891.1 hypothetical protein C814_00625 [Anaerotruncus sp. G3(2012)]
MALIACKGLSLRYENRLAVEDVSFEIEAGDYVCIVGENGAGKSTLLKGLLGLKTPDAGSISYGEGLKQRMIGYLPQQTVVQKDFPASVYEVVLSGCLNRRGMRPFYSSAERQIAERNMERLSVGALRKKSYRDLSGGQQQRVLLARALCATEKLLLLDEPVTGLDPVVTSELYAMIRQLNLEGVTVVMVSHDITCAVHNAGKILHMGTGVLFYGPAQDYPDSAVGRRFLGGGHHA